MTVEGNIQANGYGCGSGCSERGMDQSNEKCSVEVCVDKQWCDARGKVWKRGGMTMARDQVELCKVTKGERERGRRGSRFR